ncbi:mucin-5AC-like [Galendromus occidentalis]|uniref:Mucin-5AC-like n=1 Tax=Galendromus occidentalis TaxID=34638 RepID=A0AAJ7SHY6_9ACAR|nr:mucin-5AC-like [Galendromus occidentalis]
MAPDSHSLTKITSSPPNSTSHCKGGQVTTYKEGEVLQGCTSVLSSQEPLHQTVAFPDQVMNSSVTTAELQSSYGGGCLEVGAEMEDFRTSGYGVISLPSISDSSTGIMVQNVPILPNFLEVTAHTLALTRAKQQQQGGSVTDSSHGNPEILETTDLEMESSGTTYNGDSDLTDPQSATMSRASNLCGPNTTAAVAAAAAAAAAAIATSASTTTTATTTTSSGLPIPGGLCSRHQAMFEQGFDVLPALVAHPPPPMSIQSASHLEVVTAATKPAAGGSHVMGTIRSIDCGTSTLSRLTPSSILSAPTIVTTSAGANIQQQQQQQQYQQHQLSQVHVTQNT